MAAESSTFVRFVKELQVDKSEEVIQIFDRKVGEGVESCGA
jgi:hypothetical protein